MEKLNSKIRVAWFTQFANHTLRWIYNWENVLNIIVWEQKRF